jgi:hypothetical protein
MHKYQKIIVDASGFKQFEWTKSFNAKIDLVYPINRVSFFGPDYALPSIRKMEENKLKVAKKNLETMTKDLGINAGGHIAKISVTEDLLLTKAEQAHSDLIVLNRNKKGFDSFFKKILRSLPCDVLIIKE